MAAALRALSDARTREPSAPDLGTVVLFGHSHGGSVALQALNETYALASPAGPPWPTPAGVRGVVVWGAYLRGQVNAHGRFLISMAGDRDYTGAWLGPSPLSPPYP